MKYLILLLSAVPFYVLADITCPDETKCEDGETCCPLEESGYGCCPYSNAECCSDDQCCPDTTICIIVFHTCAGIAPGSNGSQLFLTPSRTLIPEMSKNEPCPGAGGSCPTNTTCCPTGCCLEPGAVCCSDGKHCCPAGFGCHIKQQKCVTYSVSKERLLKKKMIDIQRPPQSVPLQAAYSFSEKLRNVICPGGEYYCADNNTCCLSDTGDWKCCPLSRALCCADGQHCCPEGTTCSEGGKSCKVISDSNRSRRRLLSWPFL